jgi:hypothetical protein
MAIPEDDQHGFRAVAERSVLADRVKDSGAVSLFPQLAEAWKSEVQAGSAAFQSGNFEPLMRVYKVGWIVIHKPAPASLACPYQETGVAVCRLE